MATQLEQDRAPIEVGDVAVGLARDRLVQVLDRLYTAAREAEQPRVRIRAVQSILMHENKPAAMIDIATLTGSALGALGTEIAAVLSNDEAFCDSVRTASARVDEPVWQLPLEVDRYRKLLDSTSADMRNIGGPYAGTITASIFLNEFVDGVPWAHLDIAGPMKVDADSGINSKGATGFGTRLLLDLATTFTPSDR